MIQQIKRIKSRLLSSDIGRRVAHGTFWMFVGTALGKLLVLIAGIIVANILGKEQYGELGLVRSTISMFVILGTAGLGLTATKYIAEYKDTNKEKVSSIFVLTNGFALVTGLIIALVVLCIAPYLAETTLNAPHLVNEVRIGALLLFIAVLNSAQSGVLLGFEDFKSSALTTFYASLAEFAFMIIGAYYWGVIGALVGFGIGYIVMSISYFLYVRKNMISKSISRSLKAFNKNDLNVLYKFSLPAALATMMGMPVFWAVRVMLANSPNGYGELGIYEAADQWKIIILFIPTALCSILLPILTSTLSGGDTSSYWKTLKYNVCFNAILTFILATLISICSSWIMRMYGEDFDDVWTLVILVYSTVFTSISSLLGYAIVSKGKMWIDFICNIVWAIFLLLSIYLLLRASFGAKGVSISMTISYIFKGIIQLMYLYSTRNNAFVS